MKRFLALLLAVVMLCTLCACGKETPKDDTGDTIKIGCVLPLSGGSAYIGELEREGVQYCVDYYNAKGGELYHLDPDCRSVGAKYKPMSQFMFTELDQAPYNELRPCNQCGAPIPDD